MTALRCLLPLSLMVLWSLNAAAEGPVAIGVSVPLTGEAATYGTDIKNTLQFMNERLYSGRYRLIIEDDKCSGKEAVSAAQKLAKIDKVRFAIGYGCSGALLAAAPVFEKEKIVVMGVGTSSPDISKAGEYIFRTCPSDMDTVTALYKFLRVKHRFVGVLNEETEYAETLSKALQAENAGEPLKFAAESFAPGTADLRPVLLRLKQRGPEAFFLNTQTELALVRAVKQIRELDLKQALYAVYWPASASFLSAAGVEAEGLVFVNLPQLDAIATPRGMSLYREFISAYGPLKSADIFFYLTAAAFEVMDQASQNSEQLKDSLYSSKFPTIIGDLKFDANGDVSGIRPTFNVVHDGKAMPYLLRK